MDAIEIFVAGDVKRAAIHETLNKYDGAVATLCQNTSTGYAEVRIIGADDEIPLDVVQIIDLSETDAYGSYIDSLVDPEARLHIPKNTDVLAIWGTEGDSELDSLADEYATMLERGDAVDWDGWIDDNLGSLYTIDDAWFDLWELVVEDIEYDGRYAVVESE